MPRRRHSSTLTGLLPQYVTAVACGKAEAAMTVAYGARGSADVPGSDVWRITGTGTQCHRSIRRDVRDKRSDVLRRPLNQPAGKLSR